METIQGPGDARIEIKPAVLLLVDDEENILSALRRLLRRDNYVILTASSGEQGLEILAHEKVDLIVSDQRMPGMLGTVFLHKAQASSPDSVRIILSGYTDLDSVTAAINEGAVYKFLTKPWEDEILRLSIREALHHKWVQDENRMLQSMLVTVNEELAVANRKLAEQAEFAEASLAATQELLHALPMPLLGVGADGLLMFANHAGLILFSEALQLCRPAAAQLPAELAVLIADPAQKSCRFALAGQDYQAQIQSMPHAERGLIIAITPVH
ncbi:response regulator [Uliginosibacterium aquaticum]|uniref:Response regulator n=1 Tax=Uliginosibacterium aquaticum TaxID=2731212 RepID=A0ABX2IG08_9RHOO|nr:response regulator [Uliginosibacterium aquaticum]NSL55162.1 response regulator [Uliginosibacterium aquaticum]